MKSQLMTAEPSVTRSKVRSAIAFSLLLMTLGVALYVRLLRLADLHYWFDETFSLRMSQFSLYDMVLRCTQDTHPPFFFIALKGWTALFGDTELAARMFSTLWSLGAVAAGFGFTYEAMRNSPFPQASPTRTLFASTIAALCLALSPMQIAWAQQVRMYSPVACLSVLSTWMLWRAIHKHDSRKRWVLFGIVELVGLYTHVTMLFIFAGHLLALTAIAFQARKNWPASKALTIRSFIVMLLVGIAAMPWVVIVRMQHSRVHDDFWVKPFNLQLLGEEIVKCFMVYQRPVPDVMLGLWIGQGVILALLFVAIGRKPFHLLVSLTAVTPFVLLVAVSLLDVNIVNARYFIAGQSVLWVVAGVAIAKLPGWILRIPVAAVLLGAMGYLTVDYHEWREEASVGGGIPELLSTWQEHHEENKPLVFCNPMFYTTARFYTDDTAHLKIFRSEESYYPFFIGTAVTSENEYLTREAIESDSLKTVWVCDFGGRRRYLQPVELGESWKLMTEASMKDYSGTFFLRRYDRLRESNRRGSTVVHQQ